MRQTLHGASAVCCTVLRGNPQFRRKNLGGVTVALHKLVPTLELRVRATTAAVYDANRTNPRPQPIRLSLGLSQSDWPWPNQPLVSITLLSRTRCAATIVPNKVATSTGKVAPAQQLTNLGTVLRLVPEKFLAKLPHRKTRADRQYQAPERDPTRI